MKIADNFELDDKISGLRIKVIKGITMDRLHIDVIAPPLNPNVTNRDFFFTRDGEFDGTGSDLSSCDTSVHGIPGEHDPE